MVIMGASLIRVKQNKQNRQKRTIMSRGVGERRENNEASKIANAVTRFRL